MWDLIYKIIENNGVWALIGVVVGIVGNVFIRLIRDILHRRRVKKALRNELIRNLYTIVLKKDIIRQIIENLKCKQILSGKSVNSASNVYNKHLSMLSIYLNKVENDNLHIIYEHLRHNDKFMDEFETRLRYDIDSKRINDVWLKHENEFKDINADYDKIQSLIKDYLKNKPKDIFADIKVI
ncbi:MAG: hypothetical protein WC644_07110 [Ignavibacteria bacterium]